MDGAVEFCPGMSGGVVGVFRFFKFGDVIGSFFCEGGGKAEYLAVVLIGTDGYGQDGVLGVPVGPVKFLCRAP